MSVSYNKLWKLLIDKKMSASDYHAQGVEVIKADNERLKAIGEALTESYDRWEELETKREQIEGV